MGLLYLYLINIRYQVLLFVIACFGIRRGIAELLIASQRSVPACAIFVTFMMEERTNCGRCSVCTLAIIVRGRVKN
jgi:hypothetical protein